MTSLFLKRKLWTWSVGCTAGLWAFTSGVLTAQHADVGESNSSDSLTPLVVQFFESTDSSERSKLIGRISEAAGGSVDAVSPILGELQLWNSIEARTESLEVLHGNGSATTLQIVLPDGYDSRSRYSLILTWPIETPDEFKIVAGRFIVAYLPENVAIRFNDPREVAQRPQDWVVALRRHLHVDSDRVYLFGAGHHADSAFLLLVQRPDLFAGALVVDGMLDLPFRRELGRLMIGNLGDTPTRIVWTEPVMPPNTELEGRRVRVALANRELMETVGNLSLPIVTDVRTPADAPVYNFTFSEVFKAPSNRPVKSADRWFRFPQHGRTGLLNVTRQTPPIWTADQLDIVSSTDTGRSEFYESVFSSLMGRVRGRIEGQTAHVESWRCESVELTLGPEQVDFSKPVKIRYNGKRRFAGLLRPRIRTLLETAYANWEFQHLVYVRMHITDTGPLVPF